MSESPLRLWTLLPGAKPPLQPEPNPAQCSAIDTILERNWDGERLDWSGAPYDLSTAKNNDSNHIRSFSPLGLQQKPSFT